MSIMKSRHWLLLPGIIAAVSLGLAAQMFSPGAALNGRAQSERVLLPVRHATRKAGAFFVVLQDAARQKNVWTTKMPVREFLRKEGVALNAMDRVYPGIAGGTFPGMFIKIVRVSMKKEKRRAPVPFKTVMQTNPRMLRSQKKIVNPGKAGVEEQTVLTYFKNGLKVSSRVISKRVVQKPADRVVMMGTAFAVASRYSPAAFKPVGKSSEDHLNKTVAPASEPSGELQFDAKKSMVLTATAYSPFCRGCSKSGKTATGIKAKKGVVAVDPRVIPLGTKLYIPGYGYALAADTGGAIKGKRIDLCFNTRKEVSRFGRKKIKVYILK